MKAAAVSYFRPKHKAEWLRLARAAPFCDLVLMSPNPKVGSKAEPDYVAQLAVQRALGQKVLTYCTMNHRDKRGVQNDGIPRSQPANVVAQIDHLMRTYRPTGIFVDEMDNDGSAASINYVKTIGTAIRARGGFACFNPGTQMPVEYLPHGDLFMIFEGTVAMHEKRKPRPWEATARGRLWHAVHGVKEGDVPGILARAAAQGAAYVSVNMDNSYSNMPPWWERAFIARLAPSGVRVALPPAGAAPSNTALIVGAGIALAVGYALLS